MICSLGKTQHNGNRAVLRMALRAEKGDRFLLDGRRGGCAAGSLDMLRFVDQVHEFHATGAITDVVNIGIGGSDLVAMAVKALRRRHRCSLSFH